MKNKNVLKVIGIMILAAFALTWIIPSSTGSAGEITFSTINPTGFVDIFSTLEIILYYFATPSILILLVGMFYGIFNKTGGYKALVDKIVSIFKRDSWIFLLITVLFYGVTTALTGIYLPMIIFIPLSIAILLELKYKKLSAILATAGTVIVGLTAQLSSKTITSVTGATTNTYLWIKFGLLVVLLAGVFLYVHMLSDKVKGKKDEEEINAESMFVPEKRDAEKTQKQNGIASGITLAVILALLVLGLTPWATEVFTKFHTNMQAVTIGNFAIFKSILGTSEVLGQWTLTSVYSLIGLGALVIALFGKLTGKEIVESAASGAKKVMNLAIITALLSIVVIFALNSGFVGTLINVLGKSGNIALVTLGMLVGSPFMVEQLYSAQYLLQLLNTLVVDGNMELYGLISQLTYGLSMLIAPSSILLIISLCYTEEKYTSWFKYVWKLLLGILVAILIAITIAAVI